MKLVMAKEGFFGPVNLGNPEEFTIKEFAELVKEMVASKSSIVFKKLPEADPKKRRPDISLAQNVLGWKPGITLKKGLEMTIKYFKEVLK
jgi:UDP-glucuronate decarboxylase